MTAASKPYELLQDIDTRSRTKALGLPQQIEVRRTWSGVGFRLGKVHLLSKLEEVDEILVSPEMTRIPSALSWVKGIANIRGMLLPIMDLRDFIDGEAIQAGRKTRVILIKKGELVSGLMVDEVFGMRHFFEEERTQEVPDVSDNLKKYLQGAYRKGNIHWGIFDMDNLAVDPSFLEVAAGMG
ncbi:MAG: chemotaxis protein CheW [Gammaproteobacteria bacterium]|nr:chemotaxis protein CheW [Gammaproteobacteria bacterium]MDH5660089.1 chemotaxis protein CheW [Gammaproteobacteria bacterium]